MCIHIYLRMRHFYNTATLALGFCVQSYTFICICLYGYAHTYLSLFNLHRMSSYTFECMCIYLCCQESALFLRSRRSWHITLSVATFVERSCLLMFISVCVYFYVVFFIHFPISCPAVSHYNRAGFAGDTSWLI